MLSRLSLQKLDAKSNMSLDIPLVYCVWSFLFLLPPILPLPSNTRLHNPKLYVPALMLKPQTCCTLFIHKKGRFPGDTTQTSRRTRNCSTKIENQYINAEIYTSNYKIAFSSILSLPVLDDDFFPCKFLNAT